MFSDGPKSWPDSPFAEPEFEGVAPILTSNHNNPTAYAFVDPLPQAMVLTAIVIGVGITALALALARKLYKTHGTYDLDEMEGE